MCRRTNQRQNGVTLLEVIISLVVLSFLAGAIFMIVYGSTSAAAELERDRIVQRRIKSFVRSLQETFDTLPANATVELRLVERDPLLQELVIREAPTAFIFGREPAWDQPEITLALRRVEEARLNGAAGSAPKKESLTPLAEAGDEQFSFDTGIPRDPMYVGITNPRFLIQRDPKTGAEIRDYTNPLVITDEKGRHWLEILPDIAVMEWRFYEVAKKKWNEARGAERPPLIELLLTPKGHGTPMRFVFELR